MRFIVTATILGLLMTAGTAPLAAADCVGERGVGAVCTGDRNGDGAPDAVRVATPVGGASGARGEHGGFLAVMTPAGAGGVRVFAIGAPTHGAFAADAGGHSRAGGGHVGVTGATGDRDGDGVPNGGHLSGNAGGANPVSRGFAFGTLAVFDRNGDGTPDGAWAGGCSSVTGCGREAFLLP